MATQQFIKQCFNKAFDKYFYNELVIGQLACTKATGKQMGQECDIVMPGTVTVMPYDGDTLADAEKVTTSTAKVTIDHGYAVHFGLSRVEEDLLENTKSEEKQVELIKNYTDDAIKQVASNLDTLYGGLYTRAGHYLDDNGSAITLSATNAKDILAYMTAKFKRGDGKGHNSWVDGQMIAVLPPEYQFYLGKMDLMKYTETRQTQITKGFIGELCGWKILISNNIASPSDNVFYPLFGIKGKTLAGGISDNLNMQDYVPEKSFDRNYKGYALAGVGAPRADFLGTVKISAPLSL